ncbi:hypothetical protein GA0116948_10164 [Chitinophaga costaii]|uniref:S-adenosylhomocysteine hydrolase n=1 Tax=Chitinophaga costaii TaxID=1335309 RepID=A0A1C3YRC8_9BACT|nr:DUF6088 family protein [Chitinophaga costaii]PUZ30070.1 hypothetical protein DCM91_00905 [Chitinophaga costaii]SCB72646.1 hypothetical protein GA0116948_10164 [Chitinophaga costaii]
MKNSKTLTTRVTERIARKRAKVLIREDFTDLGGYDQVGRILQALVRDGKLIKIGYGLYAKTRISTLNGSTVPAAPLPTLAKEALKRLGVSITPTRAEIDYQQGRSTQVPTGRLIGIQKRFNRKISFKEATINYELNTRQVPY